MKKGEDFMSKENLSKIFDNLIDIKELCLGFDNCNYCPLLNSPICKNQKPKDWNVNNPNNPIFKFF